MSRAFESSSAGLLSPAAVLECGVCWQVYDPSVGDAVWGVEPGVAFRDLPDQWRCPSCDAPREKFMVVNGGEDTPTTTRPSTLQERVDDLIRAFLAAEENIIGLPIHNDRLIVEAIGFRPHDDGIVGVLATPWSMNIVWAPVSPDAPPADAIGASRIHVFPSGSYSFIIGRMDGFGILETCSLFSPMDDFDDPAAVRQAAEAALEGLFEPPAPSDAPAPISRRFVFTLNGQPA